MTEAFITKYFDPSSLWELYEKGSFKFGTLEEYRNSEADLARMSDSEEGSAQTGYGEGYGEIGRLEFPDGTTFFGGTLEGDGVPLVVENTFNEHIFCATLGRYNRAHHEKMLYGERFPDGSEYIGNKDLKAFVEIDLRLFLRGLRFWAAGSQDVSKEISVYDILFSRKVEYQERMIRRPFIENGKIPELSVGQYLHTIFSKPQRFKTENEFRILLHSAGHKSLREGADSLFPFSSRLRRSIIRMGKF